ncbi:hypothetical protein [Arthrobacter sp. Z4-13]
MPRFISEFNPSDLPVIAKDSKPMENSPLNAAVMMLPTEERVEEAYALILDAVYSFYFAKELETRLGSISESHHGPLSLALKKTRESVVKGAVIAIAKTIDESTGRTRSLPLSLKALRQSVEDSSAGPDDSETEATARLIDHILNETNPDVVKSLMYVRHIRNKWAGHASWDLRTDTWPTGDLALNFPLLEDGLVRMVNAFDEFGTLIEMSPYLQTLENTTRQVRRSSDGTTTLRMTISWRAAVPMAHVMRGAGRDSANQLLNRFQ